MSGTVDLSEWELRFGDHERRLRAVEGELAIRETLHRYCHSLDYGIEDDWVDCFTSDAVWSWSVRDDLVQDALLRQGLGVVPIGTSADGRPLDDSRVAIAAEGHEQLRKMVAGHSRAPERWHKHCVLNTRLQVDGDRAHAVSYFVRVDASTWTTGGYIRAFGRYLDELVHEVDGVWRIRRRHCELEAHYDDVILEG